MQNNGKNATLWPGGAFLHRGSIVEFHWAFGAEAEVEAAEAVHIIQVTYRAMNCNAIALCLC